MKWLVFLSLFLVAALAEKTFGDDDIAYHSKQHCHNDLRKCKVGKSVREQIACYQEFHRCIAGCEYKCHEVFKKCHDAMKANKTSSFKEIQKCRTLSYDCKKDCDKQGDEVQLDVSELEDDQNDFQGFKQCWQVMRNCTKGKSFKEKLPCYKKLGGCLVGPCNKKCHVEFKECYKGSNKSWRQIFQCQKEAFKCYRECRIKDDDEPTEEIDDEIQDEDNDEVEEQNDFQGATQCYKEMRSCTKGKSFKERLPCYKKFGGCLVGPCNKKCHVEFKGCYNGSNKSWSEIFQCQKEAFQCAKDCHKKDDNAYSFQSFTCDTCQSAMKTLDKYLGQRTSKDYVEKQLKALCAKIPGTVKRWECDGLVYELGDKLVDYVVAGLNPQNICKEVRLC